MPWWWVAGTACTTDGAATEPAHSAPCCPETDTDTDTDTDADPDPAEDWSRDLVATDLALDLATRAGTARIVVAASETAASASFEVGDLTILGVDGPDGPLPWHVSSGPLRSPAPGNRLDVGLPTGSAPTALTVRYTFAGHHAFDGWMPRRGLSLVWPYYCGNLFPCRSDPADGVRFTMDVVGRPADRVVVYPRALPTDAPAYVPAIATGDYTEVTLGVTLTGGTRLSAWTLPGDDLDTAYGTRHLVDVFDFFERTYGPYAFGDHAGTVDADWGPAGVGGMEHHPFWHVASSDVDDEETQAHEAAHGWFGDGVRLQCWEDFVLSEGTATYLAAHALEEVADENVWPEYVRWLGYMCGSYGATTVALPDTCGAIDLYHDPLWSGVPYIKGACFYEDVADAIGPHTVDRALSDVYRANVGRAAKMTDVIVALKAAAPDDATEIDALVADWLTNPGCPTDFRQRCLHHVPR